MLQDTHMIVPAYCEHSSNLLPPCTLVHVAQERGYWIRVISLGGFFVGLFGFGFSEIVVVAILITCPGSW